MMTGLDHKNTNLEIREMFAVTKENIRQLLEHFVDGRCVSGCVMISTCNRTELYASVPEGSVFEPSKELCTALGRNPADYVRHFTTRDGESVVRHLCRVASGLDSQILGDDQIITQTREALELSRGVGCADSYLETGFKLAIKAAKDIKTNVVLKTLGIDSIPGKAIEKLKTIISPDGLSALVIGNGQIGRLVSELLIREGANVTVTLREYKKGAVTVPKHAQTVNYSQRYEAVELADIVVSATSSPHFTLFHNELITRKRLPEVIVDLAVPRDIEPSIGNLPGLRLLTIDDISSESRKLPSGYASIIENTIDEHIGKYNKWLFNKNALNLSTQCTKVV